MLCFGSKSDPSLQTEIAVAINWSIQVFTDEKTNETPVNFFLLLCMCVCAHTSKPLFPISQRVQDQNMGFIFPNNQKSSESSLSMAFLSNPFFMFKTVKCIWLHELTKAHSLDAFWYLVGLFTCSLGWATASPSTPPLVFPVLKYPRKHAVAQLLPGSPDSCPFCLPPAFSPNFADSSHVGCMILHKNLPFHNIFVIISPVFQKQQLDDLDL